eukprot:3370833-Pleurochrysis_carterae.AAC.1
MTEHARAHDDAESSLARVAHTGSRARAHQLVTDAGDSHGFLDGGAYLVLGNAEGEGGLLPRLGRGQVSLEASLERRREHALGDIVDVLERVLGRLEGEKAAERHHLGKALEVGHRLLHVGKRRADLVARLALHHRIAHR